MERGSKKCRVHWKGSQSSEIREDKVAWLEDQCRQIDKFDRQDKSKKFFDKIKTAKNNAKFVEQASIKGKYKSVLDRRGSIMERCKEYGAELFERQEGELPMTEVKTQTEEQEPPPLISEIQYAVKRLSTAKSPGLDGIPAELIKATGPFAIEM